MTSMSRAEIRANRRFTAIASLVLAAAAAGLFGLGRLTQNGTLERLIATI